MATDIGNAYLKPETKERLYIIASAEFGALEVHTLVIVQALYGYAQVDCDGTNVLPIVSATWDSCPPKPNLTYWCIHMAMPMSKLAYASMILLLLQGTLKKLPTFFRPSENSNSKALDPLSSTLVWISFMAIMVFLRVATKNYEEDDGLI